MSAPFRDPLGQAYERIRQLEEQVDEMRRHEPTVVARAVRARRAPAWLPVATFAIGVGALAAAAALVTHRGECAAAAPAVPTPLERCAAGGVGDVTPPATFVVDEAQREDDVERARTVRALAMSPEHTSVAERARTVMLDDPTKARAMLSRRMMSGHASRDELDLLHVVCRYLNDKTCLARTEELHRKS